MSDCKEFEELLPLSDELSVEVSEAVERHLAGCEGCRGRLAEYRKILSALRANAHPDGEVLSRYAVRRSDPETPDYDGAVLTPDELERIEAHLNGCEACREAMNLQMADYREIEAYLQGQGVPETLPFPASRGLLRRWSELWRGFEGWLLYAAATVAAVVLLWVSPWLRPDVERYYSLASLDGGEVGAVTRADGGEMAEGIAEFSRGRYRSAIDRLEIFLDQNESSPGAPYARYVLGLAYLHTARSDFLGRMHRVDSGSVDRAVALLAEAERSSESRRIREDALWFLAKGHLMKLEPERALEALGRVEALDGRRSAEAHVLAEEIRALGSESP